MKKLKRTLLIVLCAVMMLPGINANALTQRQKAMSAYKKFLSTAKVNVLPYNSKYFVLETLTEKTYKGTAASNVKFWTCYIDNDSVPELIIETRLGYRNFCGVFTYKNGKIKRIFSDDDSHFVGSYRKSGAFQIQQGTDGYDLRHFYKLNGTSVSKICTLDYLTKTSRVYYIGTKRVTQTQYNKKRLALTMRRSIVRSKFYKNTKANRNKYLR